MTLSDAVKADQEGRVVEAAALYEDALSEGDVPVDALMDMAILYWQATDYGYWTGNGLAVEFVKRAAVRFREILDVARARFPRSAEPIFWDQYTRWADFGDSLSEEECIKMLHQDPASLVASMHLFAVAEGRSHREEALRLLEECKTQGTVRANYIASVIEGVLKRHQDES